MVDGWLSTDVASGCVSPLTNTCRPSNAPNFHPIEISSRYRIWKTDNMAKGYREIWLSTLRRRRKQPRDVFLSTYSACQICRVDDSNVSTIFTQTFQDCYPSPFQLRTSGLKPIRNWMQRLRRDPGRLLADSSTTLFIIPSLCYPWLLGSKDRQIATLPVLRMVRLEKAYGHEWSFGYIR